MRFNRYGKNMYVTFLVLSLHIETAISPLLDRSDILLPIGFYAGTHAVYLKEKIDRKWGQGKENAGKVKRRKES